jgi:hypothetical protein
MKRVVPDFLIIGSMKAGTNTLFRLLRRQSAFNLSTIKEPNFFCNSVDYGGNWSKGVDWYRNLFDNNRSGLMGEASTSYTKFPRCDGVVERIYAANPESRFIYLIRNPIDRSISHYLHNVLKGLEDRPIREALLRSNQNPYIDVSRYFMQINQYLQYFSRDQILIIESESFWNSPASVVSRIFDFFRIPKPNEPIEEGIKANSTVSYLFKYQEVEKLIKASQAPDFVSALFEASKSLDAAELGAALGFTAEDRLLLATYLYKDVEKLNSFLADEPVGWRSQFQQGSFDDK